MKEKHIILLFVVGAGIVVAATAMALVAGPLRAFDRGAHDCGVVGTLLQPLAKESDATATAVTNDGRAQATRTVRYSDETADALVLSGCVSTGAIILGVSPDARSHIEVIVRAKAGSPDAARALVGGLEPIVRAAPGRLVVFEPSRRWAWSEDRAAMSAKVLVPAATLVRGDLDTGTGAITVDGTRLGGLDASTGTGPVDVGPSWAEGKLAASTGTGPIKARFPALGNATLDFSTGTASIEVALPGNARHGYDVDANAGVGGVSVDLPDLTFERHDRNGVEARTRGFDARDVLVHVEVSTGTGGITLTTV